MQFYLFSRMRKLEKSFILLKSASLTIYLMVFGGFIINLLWIFLVLKSVRYSIFFTK